MTLSEKTSIEWKVVLWLLAAAVSWGVLYERVTNIDTKLQDQGRDIAEIKSYLMRPATVASKSP